MNLSKVFVIVALVVSQASAAVAQDTVATASWRFRATTGLDFSSGNYGADTSTEVLYAPFTLQATKGPWMLKAEVSWIQVSGPALLLDGSAAGTVPKRTSGSASGPGDINLYARYSVESLHDNNLFVDVTARVKIPTADFEAGLGTGEWDQAVQMDIASVFGNVVPFAAIGYRFTGTPVGYALRDVLYGYLGLEYTWSPRLSTGTYYEVRQSSITTAAALREGTAYAKFKLSDRLTLNVDGVLGFSTNSSDASGRTYISYQW